MEVYNSYKSYKTHLSEYDKWNENQELERYKRKEFLKQNPDKVSQDDIQRAKVFLHAVDVMDEYSQSNAEDMEVATDMVQVAVTELVGLSFLFLGVIAGKLPFIQKATAKLAGKNPVLKGVSNILPALIGGFLGLIATFPVIAWGTKKQVSASRKGRFEAMNSDLKSPKSFAVLTPEQLAKTREAAKIIKLDSAEERRLKKKNFDLKKTLKNLRKNDAVYGEQKAEFDKKLKETEGHFNEQLTEKQIYDAKRDQQILSNIVQKIDTASQDYAENAEFATNTLILLAMGTGGLVGWITNKLLKLAKTSDKYAKSISAFVGIGLTLAAGIAANVFQKQASRVGRFKAKQEMLNNPETLVYVDKKDSDTIQNPDTVEKPKKSNMFKFLVQLIKDTNEYKKYKKTKAVEELKFDKAVQNIDLTEDQLQTAKTLQMNVFKTFNKVDEKSQAYAEGVEAVGEMSKQGVSFVGSLAATIVSLFTILKLFSNPKYAGKPPVNKVIFRFLIPFVISILPSILVDYIVTKAQKKASRVAHMLALKELEDYRHYVDFSAKQNLQTKALEETNLLKRLKA